MTPPLFEVFDLSKRCGDNPLAFSMAPGGYLSVIFRKSAGKTTAIQMRPGLHQHPKRMALAKRYDFVTG